MKPRTRLSVESLDDRIVPARLSVSDATITEGNSGTQYAHLAVRLDAPSWQTVSVNYATAGGSAQAGSDFGAVSGKLSFARGQRVKTISVPVYGDRLSEGDESFTVNLSGARGATIHDGTGVVTIVGDDEPRITIEGVALQEDTAAITWLTHFPVNVRLSVPSSEVVTVNFATADGTATVADNDYVATSGTLTFAPGETVKTIYVEVIPDSTPEADEYFFVNLSGATGNYLIGVGQAMGWILQDESDGGYIDYGVNP